MVFGEVISNTTSNIVLKDTSIKGTIANAFSSCVIEQKFFNNSSNEQTCKLRINGGMDFIVYNVKVTVDKKVMNFVLREIEEAKEGVSQAKNAGLKYGYGARSDDSSDALIFDIGNIPKKTEFTVHIETSFVGKLEGEKAIAFQIPHDDEYAGFPISLDIDVKMQGIESVEGAEFKPSDEGGRISINKKAVDKIVFHMKDQVESSAVSIKVGKDNYIGLAMVPNIQDDVVPMSEFIIIVDCSGSMSGKPIKVARETLAMFLHSLPYDSYFNVYRFGSSYESFFQESVPYTKENLETAIDKTNEMGADLGGTDLLSPLTDVFRKKEKKGYVRQVFIITDGYVESEVSILNLASKNRGSTRCFTVGIGSGVSRNFIEEFSKTTNGSASFIENSSDVSSVAINQLTSAIKPVVSDVQIHSEGNESIEVTPYPIPPLFSSRITCIFLKNAKGSILIEGKVNNNDYEEAIEPIESNICIDKLFAFFNIRDLEDSMQNLSKKEKDKVKKNVISLSLKSGIVSQYTAMYTVITDESDTKLKSKSKEITQFAQELNARQMRVNDIDMSYCSQNSCRSRSQTKSSGGLFNWIGSLFNKKQDDDSEVEIGDETVHLYCAPITNDNPLWTTSVMGDTDDPFNNDFEEQYLDFECKECDECEDEAVTLPKKEEKKPKADKSDDVVVVLMTTQEFEGFWTNKKFVEEKAKCKLELNGLTGNQLITVFALALLELYGEVSIWRIVYNTALTWLKKQNPSFDWKKAVEDAKKMIKKYFFF